MIFVIEYDRTAGRSVRIVRFDDTSRKHAEDIRLARELDLNRLGVAHEVVLLEAVNEAALRRTHARYFEDLDEMIARVESSSGTFLVRETKD